MKIEAVHGAYLHISNRHMYKWLGEIMAMGSLDHAYMAMSWGPHYEPVKSVITKFKKAVTMA